MPPDGLLPTASPFEGEAIDYDADFSQSLIGSLMRTAVWRRLDACFPRNSHILDLGCGTGEDAVYLARRGMTVVATDPTAAMLSVTRSKVEAAQLVEQIRLRQFRWEDLTSSAPEPPFDGALSNFGALNCVEDLEQASRGLAQHLRPGAIAVLCVMGPLVPWEWLWMLRHGQPGDALRRLRADGVLWRGLRVRYPSIRRLRRAFGPDFRTQRIGAIGALIPPSYAEAWVTRHPRLLRRLARWERRAETWFPLPWLADHYLVELVRRG